MRLTSSDQDRDSEVAKNHASLEPSKAIFPRLGEKLDYLYAQISISQQFVAERLGVTSSAISQWKSADSVPKVHIGPLCKCLTIGRSELELADISAFRKAVQRRYGSTIGARWRLHAQHRSVTGLELDVVKPVSDDVRGLKAIFREPQSVSAIRRMPRVVVNDSVRFKLPMARAVLPNKEVLDAVILIVEDPVAMQVLTPEPQEPERLVNKGHLILPAEGAAPFYAGTPTGRYCAYLVLIEKNPPPEISRILVQKPDGYAADVLAAWLTKERIAHKINAIEFYVNA